MKQNESNIFIKHNDNAEFIYKLMEIVLEHIYKWQPDAIDDESLDMREEHKLSEWLQASDYIKKMFAEQHLKEEEFRQSLTPQETKQK